jgi:hypothetical protein
MRTYTVAHGGDFLAQHCGARERAIESDSDYRSPFIGS